MTEGLFLGFTFIKGKNFINSSQNSKSPGTPRFETSYQPELMMNIVILFENIMTYHFDVI